MAGLNILVAVPDSQAGVRLEQEILVPAGHKVTFVLEGRVLADLIHSAPVDIVLLASKLADVDGLQLGTFLIEKNPTLPFIFLATEPSQAIYIQAFRAGFWECLPLNALPNELIKALQACTARKERLQGCVLAESEQKLEALKSRLDNLHKSARSVTSLLDLDKILTAVVDAAVELTGAEKGSLLLLDETSGELYMRASRNFQEDFARKFRLPVTDSLAGQVIVSGETLTVDEEAPKKIKTAYLVHTLIYTPLQVRGKVIGVLGVDNRQGGSPFEEQHISLLANLADYAGIAIQNAAAYEEVERERKELETILTEIEDGVIVVDEENRLLIANATARSALEMDFARIGQPVTEAIHHQDLLEVFAEPPKKPTHTELRLEDGRVFNAQVTPIAKVGVVVTMQDITHLKELDRIKSEFVSAVSHDLRSPLTAILGYVELIGRVGTINDTQKEFIRRIQISVQNITALITDLLDLGRIEAGLDTRNEFISLGVVLQHAVDNFTTLAQDKGQRLVVDIPGNLPKVLGSPVRLRQVANNLIGNAYKYTPRDGEIKVKALVEDGQVILQVSDSGPGIPLSDQPYIFDKFYRASNVGTETPGTGLGLAIVKSIVEAHGGRVWVESIVGQGSVFTVMLPAASI
jgi:two-component system NtrC family sensor kinase